MTPEHAPSSGTAPEGQGMSRLNPAALPLADAARVLSRLGGKPVTEAMLRADIEAGAPTNAGSGGGTINLVHYAAWLVKEMAGSGGGGGD